MQTIGQQMIESFKQIIDIDFTKMPTVVFMGKLRCKLIDEFSSSDAEAIIASMSIELTSEFSDAELTELADVLCAIIIKLKHSFEFHGFYHSVKVMEKVAKAFVLKG